MAFELDAAGGVRAGPDIFVGDGVGVLGCDLDAAVGEGVGAFLGPMRVGLEEVVGGEGGLLRLWMGGGVPLFEFFAVGGVSDAADHEVCEMAVFVGEDVD